MTKKPAEVQILKLFPYSQSISHDRATRNSFYNYKSEYPSHVSRICRTFFRLFRHISGQPTYTNTYVPGVGLRTVQMRSNRICSCACVPHKSLFPDGETRKKWWDLIFEVEWRRHGPNGRKEVTVFCQETTKACDCDDSIGHNRIRSECFAIGRIVF